MFKDLLVLLLSSALGWCVMAFCVCAVAFIISLFQTEE